MVTTLNKIKEHNPCQEGWEKLLKSLNKTQADDEPLTFLHILESNGLDDCCWAMRSTPEYSREWRLFAVWCARQVEHLMTDERSINAINVAEKFANKEATQEDLAAASAAASAAAWAAASAAASAAAWDALDAARAAARDAARDAASAAAWAALDAASAAAWAAAWAAARAAARDAASAAASAAAWAALDAARAAQIEYLTNLLKTN
jgi:hypothetical protein